MYDEIKAIRQDEYQRNRFIERYKPFLAKYTSSICKRYVTYGVDEELSIALIAFNESIDRFNGEGIFFEFAKIVIRSRLLDYFNTREYRERMDSESLDDTDGYRLNLSSKASYQEELRAQRLKDEVEELKKILKYYNIDMNDLYEQRPKHMVSKMHVDHLIAKMLKNEDIVSLIIDKGYLPMNFILNQYKTTRKKIEPYRKYIIAIIVICSGQFELLKDYMPRKVIQL